MQDGRYAFSGRKHLLLPLLFLLPQLAVTVVFFFYPAGEALMGSFYMEDSFGLSREFVGFDNFITLFAGSFGKVPLSYADSLPFPVAQAAKKWYHGLDYSPKWRKYYEDPL